MLDIFQINLKIITKQDLHKDSVQRQITAFMDQGLAMDKDMLLFHENKNIYKNYTFGNFMPIERNGVYHAGNIYSVIIRTVDAKLARYFYTILPKHENYSIKGISAKIITLSKRPLERIYTLTPVIIKNDQGYWRNCMSFEEYEQRIKINLIKKYRQFTEKNIKEDVGFYTSIQLDNEKPIAVSYKNGIKLLGDKMTLYLADDALSQEMAYFAMGVGLGENNSRGFGYLNGYFIK